MQKLTKQGTFEVKKEHFDPKKEQSRNKKCPVLEERTFF
jgi:hypothetical protein